MSRAEARSPPCGPASTTRQATTQPPREDWIILPPGQHWAADVLPLLPLPGARALSSCPEPREAGWRGGAKQGRFVEQREERPGAGRPS